MSLADRRSRHGQAGSILIITLVVLVGIGTITAGLMTILQQRTVTLTEDIRMLRGLGVADSYRLALIDGRNDGDVQDDLDDSLPNDGFVDSDGDTYTGAIASSETSWGYRFIYNRNGVPGSGGGVPQSPPDGYDDSGTLKACKKDSTDCEFNAGQGKKPDPDDRVYFTDDTTLNFNPNADIELAGVIVNGDLSIVANPGEGQGNNAASLCVTERFDVGGEVNGLDELGDAPGDCKTPSSGLSGDVVWTFQTAD
ncbi:hypothetical protein BA899_01590 [Spiribacter sp. SSL99]|uniref:hypothetical protein n=1 Tax=Spiribacter sp. SSL99 TaxID=1866884 RepID=UPI0013308952|nr:hypothetical protein [Spiribacter sp. SSL99]KAF0285887.1 hypothetical protein BA899_01590 [Spiribacter sp. SSL99]